MTPLQVSGGGLAIITVLIVIGVFVEPSSSLPFGVISAWLHSACSTAYSLLSLCLPRSLLSCCSRLSTYLFHRRNPVFQLLYITLLLGCYTLFILYALPYLPATSLHHYIHPFAVLAALLSFLAACQPPTYLTPTNITSALHRYSPAPQLYRDGLLCPTCHIVKPPRSKHCSVCGRCVLRFDHHCVWVNACVGEGNHRYFIGFLVAHTAFLMYGAVVLYAILYAILFDSPLSHRFPHTLHFYVQYLSYYHHIPVGLLFLSSSLSLLLAAFTAYHLYLVTTNQTTNERHKRADIRAGRNPLLHWECLPYIEREKAAQAALRRVQGQLLLLDESLAVQHSQWSAILTEERTRQQQQQQQHSTAASPPPSLPPLGGSERREQSRLLFERQVELKAEIDSCREAVDAAQQAEDDRLARGEGRVHTVHNPYYRGVAANVRELVYVQPHSEETGASVSESESVVSGVSGVEGMDRVAAKDGQVDGEEGSVNGSGAESSVTGAKEENQVEHKEHGTSTTTTKQRKKKK